MCNEVEISPILDWKNDITGWLVLGYHSGWLVARLVFGTSEEADLAATDLLN